MMVFMHALSSVASSTSRCRFPRQQKQAVTELLVYLFVYALEHARASGRGSVLAGSFRNHLPSKRAFVCFGRRE